MYKKERCGKMRETSLIYMQTLTNAFYITAAVNYLVSCVCVYACMYLYIYIIQANASLYAWYTS